MDFVIYSVGSGAYLTEVLSAVAAIMGDGDYVRLIQIGMLIGIIFLGFQTIFNGGKEINVGQVAVGFLLYALMFGPKVDVAVHGVYDNHNQAVSEVPIGIAAPGAMVSQIGLGLTRMFETAFSPLTASTAPTGLSNGGGFVDALKILNTVRRGATDTALLAEVDGSYSGLRESWSHYIRDCSAIKINRGETTIEEMYNAPFDDARGMKFDSRVYFTRTFQGGLNSPVNRSCADAYSELTTWTDTAMNPDNMATALSRMIKPAGYASGTSITMSGEITDSLNQLGMDTSSAQQYVKLAMLEPIFVGAMGDKYRDYHDRNTAVMVNQALDQRNMQWSSEQTVFMSIVRPMMTFIEGFAYSIMPFAAFIIVMGGFGIKLATKYAQMLLWIQLWMPVLAMTNLYIHTVASMELSQYSDFTTSFYALDDANQRLAHWIAVGGMLAAATPILTLVLLTGSAYAMTSLAQRMQGADHVNEKVASPDAVQPAAVAQQSAMHESSVFGGAMAAGAGATLTNYQVGQTAQSTMKSADAARNEASQALVGSFSQAYKQAESLGRTDSYSTAFQNALNSTNTEGNAALRSFASNLGNTFSELSGKEAQLSSQLAGNLNMGLGDLLSPLGVSASAMRSKGYSENMTVAEAIEKSEGSGYSASDSAALAQSLAHTISGMSQEQLSETFGSETAHQLQSSASDVQSTSEAYEQADAVTSSIGASESHGSGTLSRRLVSSGQGGALNSYFGTNADASMRAQVDRRTNALMASAEEGGAGMSEQHARAEAQMEALYYSGDAGHTQKFLSLASGVTGGDYSGVSEIAGDAARHQGLADQQIDTPEQRGGGAYQAIPDALNPLGSGAVTREHVREHHNQGGEEVIAQRQANDREQANSAISSILDQSSSNWSGPPTAAAIQSLISGQHNASDAAGGFADTSDSSVMKDDSGVSVLGLQVGGGAVADAVGDIASRGMSSPTAVMNAAAATGLPTDQASAFAYGAMSSDQRAQFEQAGHTAPDMSSPAGQAAYAAGASYQATGSMDSARETYDGHRQAYREQFYSQNYESQGAQLIGQGMTATSPEERQAAFEQGRSMIAREAALAEGVNYDTLGDSERVRYDQHADNVTKHAIEGFSNGDGRGALQPLARHDEIVRLSQNR